MVLQNITQMVKKGNSSVGLNMLSAALKVTSSGPSPARN